MDYPRSVGMRLLGFVMVLGLSFPLLVLGGGTIRPSLVAYAVVGLAIWGAMKVGEGFGWWVVGGASFLVVPGLVRWFFHDILGAEWETVNWQVWVGFAFVLFAPMPWHLKRSSAQTATTTNDDDLSGDVGGV